MPFHPVPLCKCGSCEYIGYIIMIHKRTKDMNLECEIFNCQLSEYKEANTTPKGYFYIWCSSDVKRS